MSDRRAEWLLERVQASSPLDAMAARAAIVAVLSTLGERLGDEDRTIVAAFLPGGLAEMVRRPDRPGTFGAVEFFERVATRARVRVGFGKELADIVCAALAEIMDGPALAVIRSHLPRTLSELFAPPPRPSQAPRKKRRASPVGRTLATGRPGSSRPLCDAKPERAHTHSVARSDDPHGDTKLSSARSLGSEPLSTARPGSKRPLSEAR